MDRDLQSIQEVRDLVARAKAAQRQLAEMSQQKLDAICKAVAEACAAKAEPLAKMAVEETGYGVWQDKVLKNLLGSAITWESIRDMTAVGILREDPQRGLMEVGVPMGVVAIIFEARPNVTVDAAALCLKSGNACILRGGKEAFRSANAIVEALREGLVQAGLPREAVSLVQDTTRQSAGELMRAVGLVDLLIPRGGAGLIRSCVENALVPCIQTGTGICHVYVDKDADLEMALNIIHNAKTSRPSVCNAAEVCLVHRDAAETFLPLLRKRLAEDRAACGLQPVELRLDERAAAAVSGIPAGESDFDTEFLDYVLAVGVVDSVDDAAAHISAHSTGHSDCIVTACRETAERFIALVDSAAVYWNVSTRFTDGGEFGLGCEMGISTQKLHARGPMGLEELCSYKYVITGNGQIR